MRETTQVEVLEAVLRRLVEAVDVLDDRNVFISDADEPPDGTSDGMVVLLWVTDGQFDDGLHEGGGIHQTFEHTGVSVTMFRRNWLDRHGHADSLLTEDSIGLLRLKRDVLKALSGHDLLDENGESLLSNYMAPLNAITPFRFRHVSRGVPLGTIALTFSTDIMWNLEGEE